MKSLLSAQIEEALQQGNGSLPLDPRVCELAKKINQLFGKQLANSDPKLPEFLNSLDNFIIKEFLSIKGFNPDWQTEKNTMVISLEAQGETLGLTDNQIKTLLDQTAKKLKSYKDQQETGNITDIPPQFLNAIELTYGEKTQPNLRESPKIHQPQSKSPNSSPRPNSPSPKDELMFSMSLKTGNKTSNQK
jgi:hypothetical protein